MSGVLIQATRTLGSFVTATGDTINFPSGTTGEAFDVTFSDPTGTYDEPIQIEWACASGSATMNFYAYDGTYTSGEYYDQGTWTVSGGQSGSELVPASWLPNLNAGTLTIQIERVGDTAGVPVQFSRLVPTAGTLATHAPPLRQFPRSDGLAVSSARRMWPPSRSIQRGIRRAGGYL